MTSKCTTPVSVMNHYLEDHELETLAKVYNTLYEL